MTRAIETLNRPLSRRQVMIGVAGLSFALALPGRANATSLAGARVGKALSPWVSIAGDGTISIMSPATEMGQGTMTSLPLVIAEELDADWSQVRIVPAPVLERIYGNPGFGGMMYTAGSNAVTSYFRPLRTFGAQVRQVLLDNAAKRLGVPVEELTTEPSVVVHAKSGRRLSYGEIASFAEIPDKAPEIKPEQLKKTADFRLIGKDTMRIELPGKVDGSATYSIDVQVPGMLYGAVLRAPVEGAVPDAIDDTAAKAVGGVVRVVRLPYGVGVVAESPWAAFEAREALSRGVTWSRIGMAWGFDSDAGMDDFAADARNLSLGATEWSRAGDARAALPKAASVMEAEYRSDYAYHAQMEPAERDRGGVAGGRLGRDLVRYARTDRGGGSPRKSARHSTRQGEAELHADGRRLRPARLARRGIRHRRGAAVQAGQAAGQGDVDPRGRRPQRPLPADLGALSARRLRRGRQARRLAPPHRRRPGDAVRRSDPLSARRRQGFHPDSGQRPARLRRAPPARGAALP
jgi:isoquinoline 1-oxidoreductase beta subunit